LIEPKGRTSYMLRSLKRCRGTHLRCRVNPEDVEARGLHVEILEKM